MLQKVKKTWWQCQMDPDLQQLKQKPQTCRTGVEEEELFYTRVHVHFTNFINIYYLFSQNLSQFLIVRSIFSLHEISRGTYKSLNNFKLGSLRYLWDLICFYLIILYFFFLNKVFFPSFQGMARNSSSLKFYLPFLLFLR